MKKIFSWFDNFWFAPQPAERLALLRILIGCYALWFFFSDAKGFAAVAQTDHKMFTPVGIATLLNSPLTLTQFLWVYWATFALNLAFVFGFKFKFLAPLFSLSLLFISCYDQSWSMIYHSQNLPVLHVLILSLAPAGCTLSLDRLIATKTNSKILNFAGCRSNLQQIHWSYGWPIKLICGVTVLTYFLSGFAKISGEIGWAWASGTALRDQIAVDGLRKEFLDVGASKMVWSVYEHTKLLATIAVLTLVLELGAPLVILNKRLAQFWSVLCFGMHWGIFFIMGIQFRYQLYGFAFLSFFELEKIISTVKWVLLKIPLRKSSLNHKVL